MIIRLNRSNVYEDWYLHCSCVNFFGVCKDKEEIVIIRNRMILV